MANFPWRYRNFYVWHLLQLWYLHAYRLYSYQEIQKVDLETMNKSNISRIFLGCFFITLFISIYLSTDNATIKDLWVAFASPLSTFVAPIDDVIEALYSIALEFESGEVPNIVDVLQIVFLPLSLVINTLNIIIQILVNIFELYR